MSEDLVQLEDKGAYALIRLNRPEKRNAMSSAARRALMDRLAAVRGVHKVVVLTGNGVSFCSGVDLKEAAAAESSGDTLAREAASREWIDALLAIQRHPAVFIAAVNGFALGGGTSLIHVCDLAIAADEAEMGMPEMGFGTYPGMAGPATQLRLAPKHAAWMVLTAKRIDGPTAERWGMVNRSVPLAKLMQEADALARHVSQFDTTALAESKRALVMIPNQIRDFSSAFEHGMVVNAAIRANSDAQRAGLDRFARGELNAGQGKQT
jgi:enoyl-CoA hydratase/carnithine racemase